MKTLTISILNLLLVKNSESVEQHRQEDHQVSR